MEQSTPAAVDARWRRPRWISAATRLIGSLRNLRYGAALRIEFPSDHMPLSSLQPRMRAALELDMDYAKPADVVASMIDASLKKLALAPRDLLIRGALSGALLGAATSLAFGAAVTTGQPLVGAIVFPVGFVMIVLLGLELITGSFALLPLAPLEGKSGWSAVASNWSWVFLGNLLGSIVYGGLLAIALTNMG